MRLKALAPRIATLDTCRIKEPPKTAARIYHTPEYQAWREQVIASAGRRCQAVDAGIRCRKAEPHNRLFADHIVELKDRGDPFDPLNGQALCGAHHTAKTARARAARMMS